MLPGREAERTAAEEPVGSPIPVEQVAAADDEMRESPDVPVLETASSSGEDVGYRSGGMSAEGVLEPTAGLGPVLIEGSSFPSAIIEVEAGGSTMSVPVDVEPGLVSATAVGIDAIPARSSASSGDLHRPAVDGILPAVGLDGLPMTASTGPDGLSSGSTTSNPAPDAGDRIPEQVLPGDGPKAVSAEATVPRDPTSTSATRPILETTGTSTADSSGRIAVPDGRSPSETAQRPSIDRSADGPRRKSDQHPVDETRPAAVARAEKVNEAVREARGPSGTPVVDPGSGTTVRGSGRVPAVTAQTLPGASAGAAPEAPEDGPRRTMPGVGRGLDTLSRQRGGTLTMRLDPPSLGQLKLEMRMDGGRVTVLLTSANESARSLLRDNLGSLRQALEDRGLAVDRLAVESAGRTSEGSSSQRSENRGDGQDARGGQDAADRQDAGDGRSRGRREDASDRKADQGTDPQRPEVASFGEALVEAAASGN